MVKSAKEETMSNKRAPKKPTGTEPEFTPELLDELIGDSKTAAELLG